MDATKNAKTAQEHIKTGYPTSRMLLFMDNCGVKDIIYNYLKI
jgi:hypothetical protein